ncbi:hypothetical protein BGZ70_000997, partial [Mortierella alpina]
MKDSEMENMVDLTAEERDEIIVSYPIFRTPLKTTENSQAVLTLDTDINFVFDAAAFTKLLSEPMSDGSSNLTKHLRDDGCYSTSSPGVAGPLHE